MLSLDGTFLVMLVSFIIFMMLLKAIYFGPILKVKNEREATIEAGLQATRDAADKLSQVSLECQQRLDEARRKAQQVLAETRESAKGTATRQVSEAREKANFEYETKASEFKSAQEVIYQNLESQRDELAETIVQKLSGRQKSTAGSTAS